MRTPLKILVLCTGNSARSIIAEGLLNHLGKGRFQAYSAGSRPTGKVNPLALRVLQDNGVTVRDARSKSWDEFSRAGAPRMDIVITVCDSAAGETCPLWSGAPVKAHWGLPDPAAVEGDEAARLDAFRKAYAALERRVRKLLTLEDPRDGVALQRIHEES